MGQIAPSLAVTLSGMLSFGVLIIQVLYFYMIFEGVIAGDCFEGDYFLRGSKYRLRGFRGVMCVVISKLLFTRIYDGVNLELRVLKL